MDKKVKQIDFSRKRLANLADKYYNEGKFLAALRPAYKELEIYGGDGDVYARLSDIYEGMGLHGSALNWWFRFLDIADEQDLPDVYEGLAVNFLNMGNESASAYYYNRLIDADDSLPDETKLDIVEAFSSKKQSKLRFIYPPERVDYSKEIGIGSKALKAGDCQRAIAEFSKVEKGAKEYAQAKEMQAVAYLLAGKADEAEQTCKELLEVAPNEVRVQATLAAVYLEQGKHVESKAIALELCDKEISDPDDLYKVATVCCENGLDQQAYEKFCVLEKKLPFDGRMLYFKGVAAYKSAILDDAEKAFDELCTVYPDAEVAKYYLKRIRAYKNGEEKKPELTYFYHVPQEERDARCHALIQLSKAPKDEAEIFGLLALHDGSLRWCFDEMDGGDHDLQYLALVTAAHVRADDFLQDVLLDFEVADVLKIEILRMLFERNEDMDVGLVLCCIYRRVPLHSIKVGRKRKKRFVESYAKVASKFVIIRDEYCKKLKKAAEELYAALAKNESLDLVDSTDDCACAIFLLSGLKDLGNNIDSIAGAFDANPERVKVLLSQAMSARFGVEQHSEEKKNEID